MAEIKSLRDWVKEYYTSGYNCAETLLHAANEYYGLNVCEEDCKLMAGFGAGMYNGLTCGALVGSVAAISKKIIETKAHDQLDQIRPVVTRCVETFQQQLQALNCEQVKPLHYTPEEKCLPTCLLAADVLEKTMKEAV